MRKYSIGDVVTIHSYRPCNFNYEGDMDYIIGKDVTIIDFDHEDRYRFTTDEIPTSNYGHDQWTIGDESIECLADPKPKLKLQL